MKTIAHMGTHVSLFPMPNMVRIRCDSGPGEALLDMIYKAIRKRRRTEYFKRQQRRQQQKEKQI